MQLCKQLCKCSQNRGDTQGALSVPGQSHSHPATQQHGGKQGKTKPGAQIRAGAGSIVHPKPVPLLGKQASGEVLWAGNGENSHLIQQTPLLSLETVSGMEVGSTCVPLERNSSTGQRWAMESSRALTAKQNRKNFAGSSHRFADFSQEPWDMLPLWEDKPFFPRDRNNSHDACGIQGMDNFP